MTESEREEREMGSNCSRTAGRGNGGGERRGIAEESAGLSADTLSVEKVKKALTEGRGGQNWRLIARINEIV